MYEYGTPGGRLDKAGWTDPSRARAGRVGERQCAKVLAETFGADPHVYVFHDVAVPGYAANVDHVVVRGRKLLLVDAKRWRSGVYWTVAGRTHRGFERVEWADKQTLPAAARLLRDRLRTIGAGPVDICGLVLVFPPDAGGVWTFAYRPGERVSARSGVAPSLSRWLRRRMHSADPSPSPRMLGFVHGLVSDQSRAVAHGR